MTQTCQISSDGVTVWVNNSYSCIGRFGRYGIDIHRDISEQMEKGECLFCTHQATTKEDWVTFVAKMKELHGVDVSSKYTPDRFKEKGYGRVR